MSNPPPYQRRRVAIDEDEEEDEEEELYNTDELVDLRGRNRDDEGSIGSNPDDLLSDDNLSEEEGEDLAENWLADYAPAPELDYYDASLLDNAEVVESFEKRMQYRRAAEEALDAEDARRRKMDEEAEDDLEDANEREAAELREYDEDEDEEYEDDADALEGGEKSINLENFECPLREWISEERTRREIFRRFKKFLLTFYPGIYDVQRFEKKNGADSGLPLPHGLKKLPPTYPPKIRSMCAANRSSLEVSYGHLSSVQPLLGLWLTDAPREILQIFDEVLNQVVIAEFPHYSHIAKDLRVRISRLPVADRLRNLRQRDLNGLLRVSGVVTRRTGVFPMITATAYDCGSCGNTVGPFKSANAMPTVCLHCHADKSFKINNLKTEYGNFQKLTLQESPGSVPAGRVPRHKDVILLGDLIDIARPGEIIDVVGIYSQNRQDVSKDRSGFPVFTTVIEANCVEKRNGFTGNNALTDDDRRKIRELSHDPQIGERVIRSIAPSIYGHRHMKTAVALALFGGCAKGSGANSGVQGAASHRVRGDINVLLLGDPGTAKSQVLKYAEKTAPRAVFTTGKGASAVGLTAGVRRDPLTKEWTLEGGALVLADQGVCLIDEFDKMSEQDRTSIHEAMEQQTISVSKAGIVTSLQARCAVLAAANPIGGRYDPTYTLAENVELTDPILQRFDILCVMQDMVDPVVDEQLALFVVESHMKSHPDAVRDPAEAAESENPAAAGVGAARTGKGSGDRSNGPQPIDQDLLKKYIAYARAYVKPILHSVDSEKIASLYAEMRQQSAMTGGVPIAVRHIESVVRMAEAFARMHLREHVRDDDVDMAIKVMLESFLQAQKVSVRKTLQRSFRKYLTFGEETNQLLMHQLQKLVQRQERYQIAQRQHRSDITRVPILELETRARDLKIYDLRPFFTSSLFRNHGFYVDERSQLIVKTY